MKKVNTIYWIFTGLLAALMLLSSIPDIIMEQSAVEYVSGHLGYPEYFLPFVGVAKFLGVIALLIPGYSRIKEWVYAGFVYDLTGAAYSSLSVGDPVLQVLPILIGFALIAASYIYHHKRLKNKELTIA